MKKKSIRSPLTVSSQKSILSRLLLRCSLPLIRLREGFPWLTPEVAPLGFSEDGVTLQERGMLKETGLQAGERVSTRRLLWKRQTLSPQDAHSIKYYFWTFLSSWLVKKFSWQSSNISELRFRRSRLYSYPRNCSEQVGVSWGTHRHLLPSGQWFMEHLVQCLTPFGTRQLSHVQTTLSRLLL